MRLSESEPPDTSVVPAMSPQLLAALASTEPVKLRRPMRDFTMFTLCSIPCFLLVLGFMGTRIDLGGLSVLWLACFSLLWFTSFLACAYLGFVPAKGHIAPRSRSIVQVVGIAFAVVAAMGLLAVQDVAGVSFSYPSTLGNVLSHTGCSMFGLAIGIVPGLVALVVMRKYVPVGRASIGLGLGASGGSLAGLALLFHCSIGERFHVGLIHGSVIVITAVFMAGVAQILLRR